MGRIVTVLKGSPTMSSTERWCTRHRGHPASNRLKGEADKGLLVHPIQCNGWRENIGAACAALPLVKNGP